MYKNIDTHRVHPIHILCTGFVKNMKLITIRKYSLGVKTVKVDMNMFIKQALRCMGESFHWIQDYFYV